MVVLEWRRVRKRRRIETFNESLKLRRMLGEGFFGLSTKVVETSHSKMTDSGLDRFGKAVILRKEMYAVSVPCELSASAMYVQYSACGLSGRGFEVEVEASGLG